MDKEVAKAAVEFMKRVQLQGTEVDAYVAVVSSLQAIINAPEEVSNDV